MERAAASTEPAGLLRSAIEALAVAVVAGGVALVVNVMRSDPLPLITHTPYQIIVPCPEPGGPVTPLDIAEARLDLARTFVIDARRSEDFAEQHHPGAINLCYDWLDPIPEPRLEAIASQIAASGATRVIVYGDGGRPDSGEYLGKEISGRGIKNVFFITGGANEVLR